MKFFAAYREKSCRHGLKVILVETIECSMVYIQLLIQSNTLDT